MISRSAPLQLRSVRRGQISGPIVILVLAALLLVLGGASTLGRRRSLDPTGAVATAVKPAWIARSVPGSGIPSFKLDLATTQAAILAKATLMESIGELPQGERQGYDTLLGPSVPTLSVEAACDPFHVPFVNIRECEAVLAAQERWLSVEPLAPKFEQRTIKFRVRMPNGVRAQDSSLPAEVEAILKVPQMMFPTEPFSEAAAYTVERVLGVNRIPPTVLLPVDLEKLSEVVRRLGAGVPMVNEFNDRQMTWDQWVLADVRKWLLGSKNENFMMNSTHVWCSLQLVIADVVPLLDSTLKLPYSKAKPGWHRWFNPRWDGFRQLHRKNNRTRAALLAVAELAMMDFLLLNNDRSPNKNNFIVRGCIGFDPETRCDTGKSPSARADRVLSATFVHLDQGMALNGFPHPHNPIAKPKNNTFCWFYRPLLERVRRYVGGRDKDAVNAALLQAMPRGVVLALGRRKVEQVGPQMLQLLAKADACRSTYRNASLGETVRDVWPDALTELRV
jgi:hypothetical protein